MSNWKRTSEKLPKSEYEPVVFKLHTGVEIHGYYRILRREWWTDLCDPIKFRFEDVYEWCYEKEYESNK